MVRVVVSILLLTIALLGAACASAPTPTATPVPTAVPPATVAPTPVDAVPAPSTGDVIRLVIVPDKSEARYRVREQLANLQFPSDAVGSTNAITGTIVGKTDGTIVSDQSKFQVDLRTLKSDQAMRDGFIGRSTLQINQYPYATFVPTSAPGLPLTLPADGKVAFKLIGNLTIRDVTKPVTWDVQGTVNGNTATGTATTSFTFEYFNLTRPNVARVLSIEDNIKLELDWTLQRQ
jgi:polyisoprenoid-binding protein YceI